MIDARAAVPLAEQAARGQLQRRCNAQLLRPLSGPVQLVFRRIPPLTFATFMTSQFFTKSTHAV